MGVERHDDRIARAHRDRLTAPEPASAAAGNDVAVRAHDVDALAVCVLSGPAALADVVIERESCFEHMRGWALDFTQNRDLLGFLGDDQLVAVLDQYIVTPARSAIENASNVDDEPADGLGGA